MAPVGVSWALTQTVDGALKVGRDALPAASSDNVNALALLACEKFGATIAMSDLTMRKIEHMLRKQANAPVQKFLLAKIGYAPGGSIDALSQSAQGIRFLCLASILVSSCDTFHAATALAKMISDTAEDKAMSPTIYQLKDLLDVLEPRLNRARFMDEVAGYQALFHVTPHDPTEVEMAVPGPEAIQKIVESFRELSRVGDADAQSVRFTVGPSAAWVSAFARWSVEVPPSICDDQGRSVLDQADSQVTICVSQEHNYKTKIGVEINYGYDSIRSIVSAVVGDEGKQTYASGMVTIETHARLTLKENHFNDGLGNQACAQALPYALHLVRSVFDQRNYWIQGSKGEEGALPMLRLLNPFPHEDVIATVMRIYPGLNKQLSLKRLSDGHRIVDLPLVRRWTEQPKDSDHRSEASPEHMFLHRLSYIVADILALSLMVADESSPLVNNDILVLYRPLWARPQPDFEWWRSVQGLLAQCASTSNKYGAYRPPRIQPVLKWSLKLVGHEVSGEIDSLDWVASSFRGQVFFLRILLANEIPQNGFACLWHSPGTLMLEAQKNRCFSRILSKDSSFEVTTTFPLIYMSAQFNGYPKESIKWQLTSKADHLELSMGWTVNKNNQRPLQVVEAMLQSALVGPCIHMTNLSTLKRHLLRCIPPGTNRLIPGCGYADSQIAVYPLYGNEELKLLALASTRLMPEREEVRRAEFEPDKLEDEELDFADVRQPLVLINRGACLDCVVDVCLFFKCPYVIL